jgi:hypothetical protein
MSSFTKFVYFYSICGIGLPLFVYFLRLSIDVLFWGLCILQVVLWLSFWILISYQNWRFLQNNTISAPGFPSPTYWESLKFYRVMEKVWIEQEKREELIAFFSL